MELTDTQKKLVEENHNLIYKVLNDFHLDETNRWFYEDDWYGIAAYGLCKAAYSYQQNKKTKFSTYAYTCIKNEICLQMRNNKQLRLIEQHALCSLDNPKLLEGENSLYDFIPDSKNIENDTLTTLDFQSIYENLHENQKKIVTKLLLGYTASEIAREKGCSKQLISKQIQYIRTRFVKYRHS